MPSKLNQSHVSGCWADLTYLTGSCRHVAAAGGQSPTRCWDAVLGVCCCVNSGPKKQAQQPAAVSHCVAERGAAVAFCPARSRPPVGFQPTLGCFQSVEWLAQTRSAQIAAARRQRPKQKMRMPGVEPGSQAWEACMMPLHYMCQCSPVFHYCRRYIAAGASILGQSVSRVPAVPGQVL